MCPLIRRLHFNMYQNQSIQVQWQDSLSGVFSMRNGVKQGAVLAAVLFTVYIDGSLQRLQTSGVGSHIREVFTGAFGQADDIISLSPSVDALRHMIVFVKSLKNIKTLFVILQGLNYYITM